MRISLKDILMKRNFRVYNISDLYDYNYQRKSKKEIMNQIMLLSNIKEKVYLELKENGYFDELYKLDKEITDLRIIHKEVYNNDNLILPNVVVNTIIGKIELTPIEVVNIVGINSSREIYENYITKTFSLNNQAIHYETHEVPLPPLPPSIIGVSGKTGEVINFYDHELKLSKLQNTPIQKIVRKRHTAEENKNFYLKLENQH